MSLEYIRTAYNVPAKRGAMICYTGSAHGQPLTGRIVGARNQYLRVRFEGWPRVTTLHPTWEVEYIAESEDASP